MIQNARIVSENTPIEVYAAELAKRGSPEFVVRAHVLSEILRNAQRWVRGYESPESKALKFGSVFDCRILTAREYHRRYCVLPADAPRRPSKAQINAKRPSPETVAAIEWWNNWKKENPGEEISAELDGAVTAAMFRLSEDDTISDLIQSSKHQVMIVAEWADKATGLVVPIKCLIDIVPPADHPVFSNSLWDLKTTANASPKNFMQDAQRYMYHLPAAFYLAMFNAATGENRKAFGHVVIENYHPYEYRTPPPFLTERFLDFGRQCYQAALSKYCRYLHTGEWKGYDSYDPKRNNWPETDCYDSFLNFEVLYDPIQEPEEDEAPGEESEPQEVLP